MIQFTPTQKRSFRKKVLTHYRKQGRHDLPWRKTRDAYKVLVSEIMLQQTQVDRVIPKYRAFIKRFPTIKSLAAANAKDVLAIWQGLGYNRRALYMHALAKKVVQDFAGTLPHDVDQLLLLPGVGAYTAAAVAAFASNKPVVLIETNIRTVYLHHFFAQQTQVKDVQILEAVRKTLDDANPREWYWALMDYGNFLKQSGIDNHRSAQYSKQSVFKGSLRQVRGEIIKELLQGSQTRLQLLKKIKTTPEKVYEALRALEKENFIVIKGVRVRLK
jgi:A/G-specific adenine glycosylase